MEAITPSEARAIRAELKRLRERPPPANPTGFGCIAALVALGGLIAMPFVAPWLGLGVLVVRVTAGVLVLTLLVGGLLSVFGGGFVRGAIATDADEAIDELILEYPDGDEAIIRQAAIRILDGSTASTGPVTVESFDAREVAERLGGALGYVKRVERFLLAEKEIYPVFTMEE